MKGAIAFFFILKGPYEKSFGDSDLYKYESDMQTAALQVTMSAAKWFTAQRLVSLL